LQARWTRKSELYRKAKSALAAPCSRNPLHSHGLANIRRSKRFASNALHTNMQVQALSRDYSQALRKLHRFAARREGRSKNIDFLPDLIR
jgi:hypothetical protein